MEPITSLLMPKIAAAALIAANRYALDDRLIMAIVQVESNFNPNAVGKSHGEIGLMQLRPEFHPGANHNIYENVMLGSKYLAEIRELKASQYPDAWWVFYNHGPNSKLSQPKRTVYYKKVMDAMADQDGFYELREGDRVAWLDHPIKEVTPPLYEIVEVDPQSPFVRIRSQHGHIFYTYRSYVWKAEQQLTA